jgi:hypothetical protein
MTLLRPSRRWCSFGSAGTSWTGCWGYCRALERRVSTSLGGEDGWGGRGWEYHHALERGFGFCAALCGRKVKLVNT